MIKLPISKRLKGQRPSSLLGLSLDGSRLDGLVVRRTNGALQLEQTLSVSLALDPLTNDAELVGREIRNHLDAAGVRERQCVVGLPLKWAMTSQVELPDLPDADIASFLQIEAERSFPCDVQTLHIVTSRTRSASGKPHATLVGIPKNSLMLLAAALRAAKLKPVSFSLGIAALQPPGAESSNGVMALAIGETHVGLQVTAGGGIAALRTLEGALEVEGSQRVLQADLVSREARITLGQLPTDLREAVKRIRVFGPRELAHQLADEIELRLDAAGLEVEAVGRYATNEFGVQLPPNVTVSPAFSLAAEKLAGRDAPLEFLLPEVSQWQHLTARYASGRLRSAISTAAAIALLVGGAFFIQQCQLWHLQAQWSKLAPTVRQLDALQQQIRQYRPWDDNTVRGLTILKSMTEKFPQDGSVTAKTIEIKDLNAVTCTGTARSYQDLLKTVEKLRSVPQVTEANVGPARGQPPALQFTFNFQWGEGGSRAN